MTKQLILHDDDYREVINGLQCVMSDRCGSPAERQQVQDVIDRIQSQVVIDEVEPITLVSRPLNNGLRETLLRQGFEEKEPNVFVWLDPDTGVRVLWTIDNKSTCLSASR